MSGVVVWITGFPSAGKSTFAEALAAALRERSRACVVLDGDAVRHALGDAFGYGDDARARYYEALARLASLVASQGLITIVPATASQRAFRDRARALAPSFVEVFVDVPIDECAKRDAKGLYAAVARGEAKNLPGLDAPFEAPEAPDVVARGGRDEASLTAVITALVGA
jgi:adenylylsulfate kinase